MAVGSGVDVGGSVSATEVALISWFALRLKRGSGGLQFAKVQALSYQDRRQWQERIRDAMENKDMIMHILFFIFPLNTTGNDKTTKNNKPASGKPEQQSNVICFVAHNLF